jgi:hypothetical protein
MAAKLTRLTHKIAIQLPSSGRELYHLQFSLQAASPETIGYTLVHHVKNVISETIQLRKVKNIGRFEHKSIGEGGEVASDPQLIFS